MSLQIKKFAIRDKMFGTYSWEEENIEQRIDAFEKECNSPVHPSLLKAFNGLKSHVAVMMSWQETLLKQDAAALDSISISAVDFGAGNTVVIKFKYVLEKLGYGTAITIPRIDFSLDVDNYQPMKKLQNQVKLLYDAVVRYHNGEFGDGEQLALGFQQEQEIVNASKQTGAAAGVVVNEQGNLSPL